VKWIELEATTSPSQVASRKVAIRFTDGEVLRGFVEGDPEGHLHAVVLRLRPEEAPAGTSLRHLAVPHAAVKAIFYVREFDGRPEEDRGGASERFLETITRAPLVGALEELDMLARLRDSGVIGDDEYQAKRSKVLERM
jgi:hypothetical protein